MFVSSLGSTSGLVITSVESLRFLKYREIGFPEPLFLKPYSREIYDYYSTTSTLISLNLAKSGEE